MLGMRLILSALVRNRIQKGNARLKQNAVMLILAVFFLAGVAHAQALSTYTRTSNAEASIEVLANHRAGFRIPRTVYGTFLENIRYSIFGGVSAELIDNPSLETYVASLKTLKSRFLGNPVFMESTSIGLPLPWLPLWKNEGWRYQARWGHAANSCRYLEVMGLPGQEVGIRQKIYLPVDHELDYRGVLFASSDNGPVELEVSLRKHDAPGTVLARTQVQVPGNGRWTKLHFQLALPKGTVALLEPVDFAVSFRGNHRISLDEIRLYPDDAIDGLDPEVINVAKALRTPILRYGGNFSSGYNWRDGTGPIDHRPTVLNEPWGFPEFNEFGTDELMKFCKLIGAGAQICLNIGSGTVREARDWVQYCQGKANTPMGALRAMNGHLAPYPVAAWEVGNEIFGKWQIGWMLPQTYAERYDKLYKAIRSFIPSSTRILATGQNHATPWNQELISRDAANLQYMTIHLIFRMGKPNAPIDERQEIRKDGLAVPIHMEQMVDKLRSEIDANPATRGKLKLACTEWLFSGPANTDWNGARVSKHYPFPRYTNLGGALTAAGWFNVLLQNADLVPIANMTGLMEFGGIYKRKSRVYVTPQYWVLWLYSNYAGDIPIATRTAVREYDVHAPNGPVKEISNVPYLDVLATLNSQNGNLVLFVVNRSMSTAIPARINLKDFSAGPEAVVRTLTGDSILAGNDAEHPDVIRPKESALAVSRSGFKYLFPARSLTVITLKPE